MAATSPTFSAGGIPSFCTPAKLKILLVPAAPLDDAEFERWASFVRQYEQVKLTEVPRASKAPPSASLYHQGEVHISFVTSYQPSHAYLAPFQLHRDVHGVLGLGTYPPHAGHDWERLPGLLRAQHPSALLHRVFAFDVHAKGAAAPPTSTAHGDMADAASILSQDDTEFEPSSSGFAGRRENGLVVFPAVRRDAKDVRFYLRTLLAEMIGGMLDQLDALVSQLDETMLETPRETLHQPPTLRTLSGQREAPPLPPRPAPASATSKMFGLKRSKTPATPPPTSMRLEKIKADAALLSGYLYDAMEGYDRILSVHGKERALAGGQDAVWFASALEGWAVTRTLLARLGGEAAELAPGLLYPCTAGKDKELREPTPAPMAWRDVAEAYTLALSIYAKCLAPPQVQVELLRSMTNETPRDYTPPLVHATACLQYARFLLALYASGGWNAEAFDQLLYGGLPPSLDTGVPLTFAEQAHLAAVSGIYRYEVGAACSAALTSSLHLLQPVDQLAILSGVGRMLSVLGFPRRAAHVARVLGTAVSGLLSRTLQARQAWPPLALAWDKWHGPPITSPPHAERMESDLFARANPALTLGMTACEAYGLDVLTTPLMHVPSSHMLERARRRVCAYAYTDMLASTMGVEQAQAWLPALSASDKVAQRPRPSFGWASLQRQLLQDLIVQCEAVDDALGQVFFAALLLRECTLPAPEQVAVLQGLQQALPRARWHGAPDVALRYWGPPGLLQAMEMAPPPAPMVPVLRSRTSLRLAESNVETTASADAPPGLHNPFVMRSAWTSSKEVHYMADEDLYVDVSLQNTYAVPLVCSSLALLAQGPSDAQPTSAHARPAPVSIPSQSLHTVRLALTPREVGAWRILGCRVHLWGSEPCDIYVDTPLPLEKYEGPTMHGLAARSTVSLMRMITTAKPADMAALERMLTPSYPTLSFRVLPAQPRVEMHLPTLGPTALMLLHGQTTTLPVQLTNTSSVPVDVVHIELEDSVQGPLRDAIAQGGLRPGDVHELERQLLQTPVLSLSAPQAQNIAPHTSITVPLTVHARYDCDWARVRVWYGHMASVGADEAMVPVRSAQLTIPQSVEPSIDVAPMQVEPLTPAVAQRMAATLTDEPLPPTPPCVLLSWDLYNASPSLLHVHVDMEAWPGSPWHMERHILPGMTARLCMPWAQRICTQDKLQKPIPKLSPGQFVVPKMVLTETQYAEHTAQFWARDLLLQNIRLRWVDPEAHTEGDVSLHPQWPTAAQVSQLCRPAMEIHMDVPAQAHVDTLVPATVRVQSAWEADQVRLEWVLTSDTTEHAATHVILADGAWHATRPGIDLAAGLACTKTMCFLSQGTYTLTAQAQIETPQGTRTWQSSPASVRVDVP
ncbi:trans-Golgi network protein [Malassezia pachydermatis]|uniref:Uncharacterized protein n=1 Tax=Malassezia pachydermatis TaxID=77020 RepID=A0A0M9VPR3_9BASI|nr:hypothetical protein Malapachy_0747 [Malassezia pachydermatis]KOS14699.1 hypothetical protein Malapachy_0747 [Malassezia pachydermatis]